MTAEPENFNHDRRSFQSAIGGSGAMPPSVSDLAENKEILAEAESNLPTNAVLTLGDGHDLIIKHPEDGKALKDEALKEFRSNHATEIDAWLAAMARGANAAAEAIASLHHQADASGPRDSALALSELPERPAWKRGSAPPDFKSRWRKWPGTADRGIAKALRLYRGRHKDWLGERASRAEKIENDWAPFSLAASQRYQARQSARRRLTKDIDFVEDVLRRRFALVGMVPKTVARFVVDGPQLAVAIRINLPDFEHMPKHEFRPREDSDGLEQVDRAQDERRTLYRSHVLSMAAMATGILFQTLPDLAVAIVTGQIEAKNSNGNPTFTALASLRVTGPDYQLHRPLLSRGHRLDELTAFDWCRCEVDNGGILRPILSFDDG